ncbi:TPA: ferrous iron transport protein A [Streptococcus suis]
MQQVHSVVASWIWDLQRTHSYFSKKSLPLGDPIEITLRGYELTLRKSEAQMIGVQITSEVRK